MPRLPKQGSTSRPRKASTAANVPAVLMPASVIPPLPKAPMGRAWLPETVNWWKEVWLSPVAIEYLPTDRHELSKLMILEDDFHQEVDPKLRLAILAEIRLQRQCFGLTPADRRRLQWTVERPRQPAAQPTASPGGRDLRDFLDPREALDDR